MRWTCELPIWKSSQTFVSFERSLARAAGCSGAFPNIPPKAPLCHSWCSAILRLHSARRARTSAFCGSKRDASRRSTRDSSRLPEDMWARPRRYRALQFLGSMLRASVACCTAAAKSSSLSSHWAMFSRHERRSLFLLRNSSRSEPLQPRRMFRASRYASCACAKSEPLTSSLPLSLVSVALASFWASADCFLPSSLGASGFFLPVSSSIVNFSVAPAGMSSPAPSSP
mmetsp:Transcript_76467/g.227880  ORF Transcript_76467/g.227880 Transcript_76467/m.227880 type:complete len:228 (-) Transcript_76467:57-740(-)